MPKSVVVLNKKKLLFWGKILLNIKSAKKNSKLTLIKKNLSTVKEKSESEFVKSGPLDIGRSISLSATCPPAVRLVQDQMRSTRKTEIHQNCPELFDGSKNNFEKNTTSVSRRSDRPTLSRPNEVNRVGDWDSGHIKLLIKKDCCFSSSLLSQLSAFEVFVIRLAKGPTQQMFPL